MLLRITCLTPKNQAHKSIDKQKRQILGLDAKRIKDQKLLAHDKFYWDVDVDDANKVIKKCATAELRIKRFYRFLLKAYGSAWKKEKKLKWGFRKMKNHVIKKMMKQGYVKDGLLEQLEQEDDAGFFNVVDADEMNEFITKELIEVKTL